MRFNLGHLIIFGGLERLLEKSSEGEEVVVSQPDDDHNTLL